MTNKIKICGLIRPEDIDAVNQALPDFAGFVFARSKRQITAETAAQFRAALDPRIPAVGVFVNQPLTDILSLARAGTIQFIQLHGQEEESIIMELKKRTDCPVIKAVRVETPEDIRAAERLSADYLLLDNGAGGTGKAFDWSLIEEISKPFFLAGGLNAGNIQDARHFHAFCLDVSSGAETDGKKDPHKIRQLTDLIHTPDC